MSAGALISIPGLWVPRPRPLRLPWFWPVGHLKKGAGNHLVTKTASGHLAFCNQCSFFTCPATATIAFSSISACACLNAPIDTFECDYAGNGTFDLPCANNNGGAPSYFLSFTAAAAGVSQFAVLWNSTGCSGTRNITYSFFTIWLRQLTAGPNTFWVLFAGPTTSLNGTPGAVTFQQRITYSGCVSSSFSNGQTDCAGSTPGYATGTAIANSGSASVTFH